MDLQYICSAFNKDNWNKHSFSTALLPLLPYHTPLSSVARSEHYLASNRATLTKINVLSCQDCTEPQSLTRYKSNTGHLQVIWVILSRVKICCLLPLPAIKLWSSILHSFPTQELFHAFLTQKMTSRTSDNCPPHPQQPDRKSLTSTKTQMPVNKKIRNYLSDSVS